MALQKEKLQLPFLSTLNTKNDPKQLSPGEMVTVDNVDYDSPNQLKKRNGFSALPMIDVFGGAVSLTNISQTANGIVGIGSTPSNNSGEILYDFDSISQLWIPKGPCNTTSYTEVQVSNVPKTPSSDSGEWAIWDNISVNGYNIVLYETAGQILWLSVINQTTGVQVVLQSLAALAITTNVEWARLGWIGTDVGIYYAEITTGTIGYTIFHTATLQFGTSGSLIVNQYITDSYAFGILSTGTNLVFAYLYGGTSASIRTLSDLIGTTTHTTNITVDANSQIRDFSLSYDGKAILTLYSTSGHGVKIASFSSTTAAAILTLTLVSDTTGNHLVPYKVTSQYVPAASTYVTFIANNSSGTFAFNTEFVYLIFTSSGGSTTAGQIFYNCMLAGSAFAANSGDVYLPLYNLHTLQTTIILRKISLNPSNITVWGGEYGTNFITQLALLSPSLTFSHTETQTNLVRLSTISSNSYLFSNIQNIGEGVGQVFSNTIIINSQTDFSASYIDHGLHIANGYMKYYDGATVSEDGFMLFPEDLRAQATATTGGFLIDGSYGYAAVYSYQDAAGNLNYSAPSPILALSLSGGTSTQTQTIRVPTLNFTDKNAVAVELYRTTNAGVIYYFTKSVANNSQTAFYVDILDTTSDTLIQQNKTLYTTGGVLENILPLSTNTTINKVNRVYNITNSGLLEYSQLRQPGTPLYYNDTLLLQVNEYGGPLIATQVMDNNLIIFRKYAIYYIYGSGPNNLGQQNDFSDAIQIISDVGCINKYSLVITPIGIMFQSQKGMYLLDRSLSVSYIGAPVESFNNLTISSANVINKKNLIIFTTTDGTWLTYNYYVQKWATYSSLPSYGAQVVGTDCFHLSTSGTVWKQSNAFADISSPIVMTLETGWISLGGVQGLQRIYKLLLLGSYKSSGSITVSVAYDYVESYVNADTITLSDPMEFQINLLKQRCKAIKIKIIDTPTANGESCSFSNMAMMVGMKPNTTTLPATNVSSVA